ncbi:uncharacterized protein [Anoplolepis gracilipes]|uniref:uncharacterized protein isoform X2 n=1 Tax=Anoplolepis gracilipes TaxID=354296 RepID=UPI003BA13D00
MDKSDEKASSPSKERTTTPVDPKLQHSSSETTTEQCSLSQIDSDGSNESLSPPKPKTSTTLDFEIQLPSLETIVEEVAPSPVEYVRSNKSLSPPKPKTSTTLDFEIQLPSLETIVEEVAPSPVEYVRSNESLSSPKPKTSTTLDFEIQLPSLETIAEEVAPSPVEYVRELSESDIVVKQHVPLTIDNSKFEKLLSQAIKEQKTYSLTPELQQFLLEASDQSLNEINFNRNFCERLSHIMEEQPNTSRRTNTLGLLPLDPEQQLCLLKIFEQLSSSHRNLFQAFLDYALCLEAAISNSPFKIESYMSVPESYVELSSTESSTEASSGRSDVTIINSPAKSISDLNLKPQHKKPEDFDPTEEITMEYLSKYAYYFLLILFLILLMLYYQLIFIYMRLNDEH